MNGGQGTPRSAASEALMVGSRLCMALLCSLALTVAACRGDLARMTKLLDVGVPPNVRVTLNLLFEDNEEFAEMGKASPLSAAGQAAVLRLLLRRGAEATPMCLGELLWLAAFQKHE